MFANSLKLNIRFFICNFFYKNKFSNYFNKTTSEYGTQSACLKNSVLIKDSKKTVSEEDLCALLQSIYSSVLSGSDPISALIGSNEFLPPSSSLNSPLLSLKKDIEKGESIEVALKNFCLLFNTKEMYCFETILLLTIEHGTPLAPILQRLLKVIRQRQNFKQRIATALALQKLSIYGIALCTILVLLIQLINNKANIIEALQTKMGLISYTVGVGLIIIGFLLMAKLVKQKIE